jgi:hypothetical protein
VLLVDAARDRWMALKDLMGGRVGQRGRVRVRATCLPVEDERGVVLALDLGAVCAR